MSVSRRDFLGAAAAGTALALTPGRARGDQTPQADGFSFVHLTDMHVTTKRHGHEGYLACVEHVNALKTPPAFALMGGDLAFDGLYTAKDIFARQIKLYREISGQLACPHHHCLGNHDVLGWNGRRKVPTSDPDLGKKMIQEALEWERTHYSFDHGGWHFAVLDSIHPIVTDDGPVYEPRIGPEQLEWLAHDLGAAGTRPKVVVTHIAAFCNLGQIHGDPNRKAMDGSMVLWDTKELRHVLERHGVKALLQGHSHRSEAYRFNGVWYLTSPAVSGAWWSGDWTGTPPGYTVFHCRGGALTWEHQFYPWAPRLEPDDEVERQKLAELRAFEAEQLEKLRKERQARP